MKNYTELIKQNPEIVCKKDNFGADFYFVPSAVRGRNKTKIFNTFINRGWKQEPNPEYLSFGEFYAHNHCRIGIIVE